MEPYKIFQIHNFLQFRNKSQRICDHPVKNFWKSVNFWARSVLLKRNSFSLDTVYDKNKQGKTKEILYYVWLSNITLWNNKRSKHNLKKWIFNLIFDITSIFVKFFKFKTMPSLLKRASFWMQDGASFANPNEFS